MRLILHQRDPRGDPSFDNNVRDEVLTPSFNCGPTVEIYNVASMQLDEEEKLLDVKRCNPHEAGGRAAERLLHIVHAWYSDIRKRGVPPRWPSMFPLIRDAKS